MNASGEQFDLVHGEMTASIAAVGASLRTLTVAGRPLVLGYEAAEVRPDFRGGLLTPWPNRIRHGAYVFDGIHYQLPITEPGRNTAIHGLASWERWDVTRHSARTVVLRHSLVPQPGYSHLLDLTATYALEDNGLCWSLAVANVGTSTAPYGCGPHPYLLAGDGPIDDWTLTLPAAAMLDDNDEVLDVPDRHDFDFRHGERIGSRVLDTSYTALTADADGLARTRLTNGDRGVELAWDPKMCAWAQVYTYDFGVGNAYRAGVAVEPMTCPPFAFNSGRDVITLAPGDRHHAEWILRPL